MTNEQILDIAMRQSAIDENCSPGDFRRTEPVVAISAANPGARRHLELPFSCNLVSYGDNVVASVSEEIAPIAEEYIRRYPLGHCFETPNLHVLNDALQEKGKKICFMAEYFLPDLDVLRPLSCGFELRFLNPDGFAACYRPEWSNALSESRRELDVLAVAAFDGGRMVGLAGCSADCDTMWQIGVDVLPAYRRMGIASALTSRLALEIVARGKAPFYCSAWCNVRSVRNAVKSGFRPAWVEMTAKSADFVDQFNRR